ncbi:MAG: NAD(P)/FAD-dependent oxidoreductase [Steroidobacteraceae bacterium]
MKIVVVGAGLSGLTAAYRLKRAGHEVHVLERDHRPGGRCATVRRDGFIIDTGPEVVAGSYTHYLRLVQDVGLGDRVVPSSPVVGTVRNGRVIDTDTTKTVGLAFTPLLSWGAKVRLVAGLRKVWKVASTLDAYAMADFAEHDDPHVTAEEKSRSLFGAEVTDYLIDPLVRMIGGTGPKGISQLLMLGGLNSWSSALCNLLGGLDVLPHALARALDVSYGVRVSHVREAADGVNVTYVDGDGLQHQRQADRCVLACRLEDGANVSPFVAEVARKYLSELKAARLIDVKVAYAAPTRSKAFACQVPSIENRELLMYALTHNKAPDRAPPNHSLFTLYTDDGVFDELAPQSDDELITWARAQMERLYPEVKNRFLFGHVGRYARAGYLATPGYFQRTAQLIASLPQDGRIQIAGDVFGAGSMEAAVLWGERAARNIVTPAQAPGERAPEVSRPAA